MNRPPSLQCLAYLRQALSQSARHAFSGSAKRVRHRSLHSTSEDKLTFCSVKLQRQEQQAASTSILNGVSNSKIRSRKHLKVDSSFVQAQSARTPTDLQRLTSTKLHGLLEICRKLEAWQELISLYQKYFEQRPATVPLVPSAQSFHYYVLAQYKVRNQQFMYSLKQQLSAGRSDELFKVETVNIVLQYFVKQGQLSEALALLDELEKYGSPFDVVSFNTVLNGARAGAGNEKYLSHVLSRMSAKGTAFSTETYNILVSTYHQLGLQSKALDCFREALAVNKASTSTYNTIMSQELSRGFWNSAWSLLLTMRSRAIPRNERTYSPFLLFLTKNNTHAKRIKRLLELMEEDVVALGPASYNTVLHSFLFSGMYENAQKVLMTMKEKSVKVTERTFDVIQHFLEQCSTTFSKHPLHDQLLRFTFAEMQRDPNVLTYDSVKSIQNSEARNMSRMAAQPNVLPSNETKRDPMSNLDVKATGEHIQALMVEGAWRPALASYNTFRSRGIIPPMQVVVSVLVGLLHSKRYYEAQHIYQALKKRHPATSDIRFQTVVLDLIKPQNIVRDIQSLLKFLVETDSRTDIVFHSAASWRLYREQKYPEAIALLRYAIGLGIILDLAAWVILVECYAKTRDLLSTIWCLQAMKDNKIILDRQARKRFKRVISTLETESNTVQVDQAWELLDHLRSAAADERAVKRGLTDSSVTRKQERPFVRHVSRTRAVNIEEEPEEEVRMLRSSSM